MTKANKEDLLELSAQQLLDTFIECANTNQLLGLIEFCHKVGYHG